MLDRHLHLRGASEDAAAWRGLAASLGRSEFSAATASCQRSGMPCALAGLIEQRHVQAAAVIRRDR